MNNDLVFECRVMGVPIAPLPEAAGEGFVGWVEAAEPTIADQWVAGLHPPYKTGTVRRVRKLPVEELAPYLLPDVPRGGGASNRLA